jgi:transcriptional antiterminator NusG
LSRIGRRDVHHANRSTDERSKPKGAKPLLTVDRIETRSTDLRSAPCASMAGGSWHVLWTRSHCEYAVATQLQAGPLETFVPEMSTWSQRAGELRLIRVPMFPGYVFVRGTVDKHRYIDLMKVRGVVRVLGDGWDRLAAVPGPEVDAIQRVVAANVAVLPHAHLSSGDRVVVVDGPLTGVEGIFVHERPQKGRLVLSVDLLGRSVAVEMECAAVVPSSSRNFA